jgi:hypothetical protein
VTKAGAIRMLNDKHPRYNVARLVLFSLIVSSGTLFAIQGSAQTPPTASEAFDLRIKCKKMSDEKAQEASDTNRGLKWEIVGAWNTSKYDPTSNRCYGRFYQHITKQKYHFDREIDEIYDLQTDDLLAWTRIENGKKSGTISDPDYNGSHGYVPCKPDGCPANFGEGTWQAAEDYIDKMMADPRKQ